MASVLTKKQVKNFSKEFMENGRKMRIVAHVRYDDECGNGHNTFSITGEVWDSRRSKEPVSSGCIHEDIEKHFKELAPLLKWHLCSSNRPLHYPANVLFHAGDKDCYGTRKGEIRSFSNFIKFNNFPMEFPINDSFIAFLQDNNPADLEIIRIDHKIGEKMYSKYTLGGYANKWHECPFDTEREALQFMEALKLGWKIVSVPSVWGEGKERNLTAARSCAIWPEATDEELCAFDLKQKLEARLPKLMEEFQKAVESLGFTF